MGHLSRVERGEREVTPAIVIAYENATGHTFEGVNRRDLLALIAVASVGEGPLNVSGLLEDFDPPDRVSESEILAVREATDFYTTMDFKHGGGVAYELGRSSINWAAGLLRATMTDATRKSLSSAVASMFDRVAWSCFDGGKVDQARKLWLTGLRVAAHGNDATLRSHIMLNLTYQEADAGNFSNAVSIMRMALGDERICNAERANLHAMCGRQLAFLGDTQGALRQVGMAEAAQADADSDEIPAWAGFLKAPGHLDSVIGRALLGAGRYEAALTKLDKAAESFGDGRTRGRAHSRILAAIACAKMKERERTEEEAHLAIADLGDVRSSGRIAKDLSPLRGAVGADTRHELSLVLKRITPV